MNTDEENENDENETDENDESEENIYSDLGQEYDDHSDDYDPDHLSDDDYDPNDDSDRTEEYE